MKKVYTKKVTNIDEIIANVQGENVVCFSTFVEEGTGSEANREWLLDWLIERDHYPLYLGVTIYADMYEPLKPWLADLKIDYETYYLYRAYKEERDIGLVMTIESKEMLVATIDELYWLAEQNNPFGLSNAPIFNFETVQIGTVGAGVLEEDVLTAHLNDKMTVVTVAHDGRGFHICTTEERFKTMEQVKETFPTAYGPSSNQV